MKPFFVLVIFIFCGCASSKQEIESSKPTKLTPEILSIPELAGTVWKGTNLNGEECEIQFHRKNNGNERFVFQSTNGGGWHFRGSSFEERTNTTSHKISVFFIMNNVRFNGTITDNVIVFDNVVPRVVAIDYEMLFGEDYLGRHSIIERFNCAGQDIGAFIVFDIDHIYARKNLEHTITFELDRQRKEIAKPGPEWLGEVSFYKWVDFNNTFPSLYFIRWNLYVSFPSYYTFLEGPEVRDSIFKKLRILDDAVKNEHPAVTVIHMPKVLTRVTSPHSP